MRKISSMVSVLFSLFSVTLARPIKEVPSVMTVEQMEAFQVGETREAALPAETFGYPNPERVLELEPALELDAKQKEEIQVIVRKLRNQSAYFGKKIVAEELILDDFFRKGQADLTTLANRLESIGVWRWRLRLTYLEAYINTRTVLTADQLEKYQTLRAAPSEGASAK